MELFHTIIGQACKKNPIVILHGLFGSHRNWQSISKTLSERLERPVYSVDLRNHGKSVEFSKDGLPVGRVMTYKCMVEDIHKLLCEINKPVVMVGHSLGGQVAMQAAFTHSNVDINIEKLVVVDIAPKSYEFSQSKYIQGMKSVEGMSRVRAMEAFRSLVREGDERIVQFIFTNYGRRADGSEGFMIPLQAINGGMQRLSNDKRSWTGRTSVPTLFIKGHESDYITPKDETEMIPKSFTNYNIITMEGAGHWPHFDKPSESVTILHNFIQ